ncbi:hypothetical protein C2E20_9158 [Micractinium conductrix]|uniref:DUF1990 domain-containing protein n=1 Tax=Micractinium conductrix TaxID=554055 RepID=A0A2P6UZ83_9CHLO|nr:hypothetical protein C2E20_9158 [Micractinium conductrix]|eukprot:PSC67147.1 hypothetical protein C2E20_9158 [Micractinium conductrix]
MESLMQQWQSRACNHEFAGESINAPDNLPAGIKQGGFMVTTNRKKVQRWQRGGPKLVHGSLADWRGQRTYDAAVKAIKAWQHLQLGWNCTTGPAQRPGVVICSATQTVVPWSVLPAQVTYSTEGAADFGPKDKAAASPWASSLHGHQLAGEERFSVELHADGSVFYDIYLFSRPDTLLAWASLPW